MTLLGKIFTVTIFIMTVLFMGFAIVVYATHRNWKMAVTNTDTSRGKLGLRPQLKQEKDKNVRLQEEIERLQNTLAFEQAARKTSLGSLQSKLDQVRLQLADREKRLSSMEARISVVVTSERTAVENEKRLLGEVADLRSEVLTTQQDRDQKFYRVVALTDEIHQKTGIERILTERRDSLVNKVASMKRVMDRFGVTEHTPITNIPVAVDGVVTAVSDKRIEISIGSDDGLRDGNTLLVSRNGSYLAQVVIRKTSPDRAVAEILQKYQKGVIKVNDSVSVTTKLPS